LLNSNIFVILDHVEGQKKLFEIRAKGKDGIARVFYFTIDGKRIILLHGFTKKTDKTPKREIDIAVKRMQEVIHG
jgi:phage-related protein